MKRIILAFFFVLAGAVNAFGQSTTVSGTITDAGSQAWANGPFKFIFQPNPQFPTGPYTWSGGALTTVITGTLDGSGHYSVSIPSNSAITPAGSTWILQITPDATSQSFSTPRTTITGGTQTLNATPPAISINWNIPPGPAISAYADGEIAGTLPKGAEYFNVTSGKTRVWNGSAWADQGGGGGTPGGSDGDIQFKSGSSFANIQTVAGALGNIANVDASGNLQLATSGSVSISSSGVVDFEGDHLSFISDVGDVSFNSAARVNAIAAGNINIQTTGGAIAEISASTFTQKVADASPVTPGSVTQRVVATTTDTILNTDRQNRVAYNSASAVAVTLPTAGSSGFAGGFNVRLSNQNAGAVTVTPATGTINGNATLVFSEGQDCFVTPSSAGTSWAADCNEPQITAGNGISFTRAVHGLTITNSAAAGITNNVIPKGTGTSLANSSITDNGTTVSTSELVTFSGTAAASVSPFLLNGTIFSGGTATTTVPYAYLNFGTAPTSFNTSGTIFGINGPSGFTGNLVDFRNNGGSSFFNISATGAVSVSSTLSVGSTVTGSRYVTGTNCSSSASPAVCSSASAGSVAIAASATTIQVNTTAVGANSQIFVQEDSSLGTKLGVTCNTTIARTYAVTARTAATSFVITTSAAPVTNPACLSYWVLN